MGAKTWLLAYVENDSASEVLKSKPKPNRSEAVTLAKQLFPKERLQAIDDVTLLETSPPDNEIYIGCFPALQIVCASEFAIDNPSKLPKSFINAGRGHKIYLHAMHSSVDWFAYAVWKDHKLERSLSLAPDTGIIEDLGSRLSFEEPYWSGAYPAIDPDEDDDDYPFPFHPLELGEAALHAFFGFQLEGPIESSLFDPEDIRLMAFKRLKPWWKIW